MDINAFNAIKTYSSAQSALGAKKPAAGPEGGVGAGVGAGAGAGAQDGGFKPMEAAKEAASAVVKSEQAAAAFMTGQADPHSVVEAIATAELAVETAVTLRNRVVEAYQELLRMPI